MLFAALVSPLLAASVVSAACSGSSKSGHRRHHGKNSSASASSNTQAALAANPKSWSSTSVQWSSAAASTKTASSSASAASASSSSSSSSSTLGWALNGIQKNGIYIGWVPDDGSGGGTSQTQAEINTAMGMKGAAQGWYAQARSGVTFDGSQLTSRMDAIVASGGVFQPAIMPTGGWQGLTYADNSQAINIANVLKKFTDKNVEVWLRFAHEVNYYQTDGTYNGDENDFKEGWAVVAAAVKQICPEVKMWFTPNIENLAAYQKYYPDDPTTVDLIGVDWYPKDPAEDFVAGMQGFHDQYTSDTVKFAQGETGLAQEGTMAERVQWLTTLTSSTTATAMPNYIACSWFNYWKGYEFRIAAVTGDQATISYLS